MRGHRVGFILGVFLLAVFAATVLGSIVQTQFNVAALSGAGLDLVPRQRFAMTLHDLGAFTPVLATITLVAFAVALPVAALFSRAMPRWRPAWFLLAGATGLFVALVVVNAWLPMPTFIAATRSVGGLLAMMVAAAVGSGLFGYLYARA